MEIIIDPYKLLSIINSIDKLYSEIVIPFPLQFIEIWHPKWRQFTFRPFEDDSIMDKRLESLFGYNNGITTNNFVAGIQLFRMAYEKGMVSVIDLNKSFVYDAEGKDLLKTKQNFYNGDKIKTGFGTELYINPDLPVSEMLLAMQNDGYNVLFGNSSFVRYWNNKNQTYATEPKPFPTPYYVKNDGKLETLIYTNKINNVEEAFAYVNGKNAYAKLDVELRNTIKNYKTKKKIALLTLEFTTVTTVDTLLGFPAASSTLFVYNILNQFLQLNNASDE